MLPKVFRRQVLIIAALMVLLVRIDSTKLDDFNSAIQFTDVKGEWEK
jgi:hypothetical protein